MQVKGTGAAPLVLKPALPFISERKTTWGMEGKVKILQHIKYRKFDYLCTLVKLLIVMICFIIVFPSSEGNICCGSVSTDVDFHEFVSKVNIFQSLSQILKKRKKI